MDPLTWEQVEAGEEIPGVEPLGMCKRVSFKKCVEEPYPQDGEKCNDGMGKTNDLQSLQCTALHESRLTIRVAITLR